MLNSILPLAVILFVASTALAQPPATYTQTETDEYTRYELLSPESASFAIRYEVTASTAGADVYFNPIRKGSVASGESVIDVMTGQPLQFEVVTGDQAVKDPLMKGEDTSVDYIKVHLARPVPKDGQARLLILKTYKDPKSYYREGDTIVFNRPLSIPRNSVVLPAGYELVACNVPSQVLSESDGRIAISFMNGSGAEAPLIVKAKVGAQTGAAAVPRKPSEAIGTASQGQPELWRLSEQAHGDFENVYMLQQPESHAVQFHEDYTWDAETDQYTFGVHAQTTVTDVSAYVLDTGEALKAKLATGAETEKAKKQWGGLVEPFTHVVAVSRPPMKNLKSVRVRLSETLTIPTAFRLDGDELVFDQGLRSPRNAVVLPEGWYLTASSIPATVTQMPDGRIRLDFWNGRPDSVDVLIKAQRRTH
jgi:hypothetical protein